MKNLEKRIIDSCLERFDNNLAAILIFGSYNTGQFVEGVSDIDMIILFKEESSFDFEKERYELGNNLADINPKIVHFRTINDYEKHIYEEGSWSSWITVIRGSRAIYSTNEFDNFRNRLLNNPIPKEKLLKYIKRKDNCELEEKLFIRGNNEKRTEWQLTKWLFLHIRRKLQILNYYIGNKLEFDYKKCLDNLRNIKGIENENMLKKLGELYGSRRVLKNEEIEAYLNVAKSLTNSIIKIMNKA